VPVTTAPELSAPRLRVSLTLNPGGKTRWAAWKHCVTLTSGSITVYRVSYGKVLVNFLGTATTLQESKESLGHPPDRATAPTREVSVSCRRGN
jgi:hypothetical protein